MNLDLIWVQNTTKSAAFGRADATEWSQQENKRTNKHTTNQPTV